MSEVGAEKKKICRGELKFDSALYLNPSRAKLVEYLARLERVFLTSSSLGKLLASWARTRISGLSSFKGPFKQHCRSPKMSNIKSSLNFSVHPGHISRNFTADGQTQYKAWTFPHQIYPGHPREDDIELLSPPEIFACGIHHLKWCFGPLATKKWANVISQVTACTQILVHTCHWTPAYIDILDLVFKEGDIFNV
jgi:hypothetical protein